MTDLTAAGSGDDQFSLHSQLLAATAIVGHAQAMAAAARVTLQQARSNVVAIKRALEMAAVPPPAPPIERPLGLGADFSFIHDDQKYPDAFIARLLNINVMTVKRRFPKAIVINKRPYRTGAAIKQYVRDKLKLCAETKDARR
jgi:hypothetical protein